MSTSVDAQGWMQISALGVTLSIALLTGALSGFLSSKSGEIISVFDDFEHWDEVEFDLKMDAPDDQEPDYNPEEYYDEEPDHSISVREGHEGHTAQEAHAGHEGGGDISIPRRRSSGPSGASSELGPVHDDEAANAHHQFPGSRN